jgi:hypothetical protein
MPRLIQNYKHFLGSHCASAQMRDILQHNGIPLSEEMCFGIGAGLGFIYRKAFNPPFYFVLGRSDDLEEKISYHLGGIALRYTTDNSALAWREAMRMVDDQKPVLVNVDASELPYLRERFNLFEHVRYGGHRVTIVGYDAEKKQAILSDYLWNEPQIVSWEELEKARGSEAGQMPAENLFFTFLLPEKIIPLETAVLNGISLNVQAMLHPWYEVLGLSGLKKFCTRVLSWPRFMPEAMAMKNAQMTYMMMEVVGTGGGNFRRLFARFLREAEPLLGEPRMAEACQHYARLGNLWKEIAYLLKESAGDITKGLWDVAKNHQKILDEIYRLEERGLMVLKEIVDERL